MATYRSCRSSGKRFNTRVLRRIRPPPSASAAYWREREADWHCVNSAREILAAALEKVPLRPLLRSSRPGKPPHTAPDHTYTNLFATTKRCRVAPLLTPDTRLLRGALS